VTRHNNSVLKNIVEELKTKNEGIEGQLQESKAEIEQGTNEMASMKKTIEESELKVEKLEEVIGEFKTNQTKLVSDLENCKSTDADLVVSQQETKECNQDLESETKRNLQCESDQKTCERELEKQVQKYQKLQAGHSNTLKALEESRSTSSANQKLARECKNELKDVVVEKAALREKLDSVCKNQREWSEWSGCSKTCRMGIKTRIDRCSNSEEQVESCNQDISCPKSGKYF